MRARGSGCRGREGRRAADQVRLLDDGTLVRTRFRVREAGVDAVSELSVGRQDPWFTVRGSLVEPGVSDGTSASCSRRAA